MKLDKDGKNLVTDFSKKEGTSHNTEEDTLKALDVNELEALTATRAANNLQREKDLRDIAEKDANRERRGKTVRRVIALGIMVVIILMLLVRCNRNELPEWIDEVVTIEKADTVDTETLKPDAPMESYDPNAINLTISMNSTPVFESGLSEGNLEIRNSDENLYNQYVTICLGEVEGDESKLIYTSGIVEIGKVLPMDTLDVNLPAGEYRCVATFTAVDPETSAVIGRAAAKIIITVLDTSGDTEESQELLAESKPIEVTVPVKVKPKAA